MTELQTQCLHIIENLLKGELAASAAILKPSYVMAHCEIESSWRPDVLSHDGFGSRGLMQVLPETAREMGVQGSQAVPANSILAGMRYWISCHRYLSKHLNRPVTVEDVVAAYNEGPGNVLKGRQDLPYVRNWHIAQAKWAPADEMVGTVGPEKDDSEDETETGEEESEADALNAAELARVTAEPKNAARK